MRKLATLILSLSLVLSLGGEAFASSSTQIAPTEKVNLSETAPVQTAPPAAYNPVSSLLNVSPAEVNDAQAKGLEIVEKITDSAIIQSMVNAGMAETDNGKLPTSITTYVFKDNNTTLAETNKISPMATGISVTKTKYYDGQYFDDYDRYKIDGPSNFSTSYSKTGTRNWNTSATGSVEVGGKVYGVADVKASVSGTVGYSFGDSETKTQTYTVNIPDKKYWVIKVWVSYLVYEYTAKVGSTTIATGKTWRPNGLVIQKTEYTK